MGIMGTTLRIIGSFGGELENGIMEFLSIFSLCLKSMS